MIYRLIVRTKDMIQQNDEIKKFLQNSGLVLGSKVASILITMFATVLSARVLGVESWGQLTLILSLAGFLIIPIVFGVNNAMVKFLPISNEKERQHIMSSAIIVNLCLCCSWFLIYFLFGHLILEQINIPSDFLLWIIIVTVSINFNLLSDAFLRGLKKYSDIAIYKLISTLILTSSILALYFVFDVLNPYSYLICFVIHLNFFTLIAFIKCGVKKITLEKKTIRTIYSYGGITMLHWTVTSLLFSSDLFIVSYYESEFEVGIFSVYQTNVKNLFIMLLHEAFLVVFLPTIASMNLKKVYKKISKYALIILPVITLGTSMVIYILLFLYGKEYPVIWLYIILSSIGVALAVLYQVYVSVITMEGNKGALFCLMLIGIPLPLLLGTQIMLTKYWGILGTMISIIIIYAVLLIIFQIALLWRWRNNEAFKKGDEIKI